MIKIENTEVHGWEAAIRGMRNPLNSWKKSDSGTCYKEVACHSCSENRNNCNKNMKFGRYVVGVGDLDLMKRLAAAGPDHRKYLRMINVSFDLSAPAYWWAEFDTYKVGTVRDSCSFMHKGVSMPYKIEDFSLKSERIYYMLKPFELTKLTSPGYTEASDECKIKSFRNGLVYRVYRNGRIVLDSFGYTSDYTGEPVDGMFGGSDINLYTDKASEDVLAVIPGTAPMVVKVKDIVAKCWVNNPQNFKYVVHLNGDRKDNSAGNLDWSAYPEPDNDFSVEPIESYMKWKDSGYNEYYLKSDYADLFDECRTWEKLIETLNSMRELYLITKDEKLFQEIRSLMPSGLVPRSTIQLNYEVLRNMYHSRKTHRLDEWHEFCEWIESLPHSELITE